MLMRIEGRWIRRHLKKAQLEGRMKYEKKIIDICDVSGFDHGVLYEHGE